MYTRSYAIILYSSLVILSFMSYLLSSLRGLMNDVLIRRDTIRVRFWLAVYY